MKRNRGVTLVELIVVMACLGMVTLFFWWILNSSTEDRYTLTEKMEVQNSVTALLNIIQQDIQEAKIYNISGQKGILDVTGEPTYKFKNFEYVFSVDSRKVTKKIGSEVVAEYGDIIAFKLKKVENGGKYGVEVKITGGKKPMDYEGLDKSRYSLNSTFYTRNTI